MTTQTQTNVADLARQLATNAPLDGPMTDAQAGAAVAFLITRAGVALSALRPNAANTLDALLTLDARAGNQTRAAHLWLAIRALALKAGDVIGVAPSMATNPVLDAIIGASGLSLSVDTQDTVAGAIGVVWPSTTLAAPARCVVFKGDLMDIREGDHALVALDTTADARGALGRIDALATRAQALKNGPQPVRYTVKDEATLEAFATENFAPYQVRRITIIGAQPHPTEVVESAALSSVLPPVPSYEPLILPSVISSGALSDVQLETIIAIGEAHGKFLPAHPNDANLKAPRQAFLIGHGTGLGKGRIVAGTIADNWAQGRRRHVWISESAHLIQQARADWVAVGGRADDVWDARDLSSQQALPAAPGIVFLTYAALRSEHGMGRVAQITDWMGQEDGVIAFDEAQNLRNTMPTISSDGWTNRASAQAQAARTLQDNLPNGRVLYASATSASDILSLAYAYRLGLWGEGTAFASAEAFFVAMQDGGTNALEMVARDMKAMGLYLSANLSYAGVTTERLEHRMSLAERRTHDGMSALWLDVARKLKRAIVSTGIQTGPAAALKREHKRPDTLFNQARNRFFQATIAAMKTPVTIAAIKEDLKNGHSAIVQLTNTFEANADRAIAAAEEAGLGMDSVSVTPRDILLGYLYDGFPIHLWERIKTAKGGVVIMPKVDANGQQMICPNALAQRDALIAEVEALPLPEGPLEQILDAFGADMVAEATGRGRRFVPGAQGRILQDRDPKDLAKDVEAYQNGSKLVLCFTNAGGTGQTYSAQRTCANRRKRRHYLLQVGWRSDLAIQGMGRSHRSDQVHAPEYILVSIDLWADQRMISRVARGMRDLGAITRGLRQAASQDFFTQDDNLEGEFGQQAWRIFIEKLHNGDVPNLSLGQFELESNLSLRCPITKALPAPHQLPPVHRFLNAMSAMSCAAQTAFGQVLRDDMIRLRTEAIAAGTYDRGIETIRPDSLIKLEDVVIHRDARTGGETRLLKMLRIDTLDPMAFDEARQTAMMRGSAIVAKSLVTGRVAIVCFPASLRDLAPKATDRVRIYTPTGMRERTRAEVVAEGWQRLETSEAQALWAAESRERGQEEEQMFWVVSGTLLPIWDKLPKSRGIVYRMESDEGEQIIGRIIHDQVVDKLLTRVDALSNGGLQAHDVLQALSKGGMVHLANGWTLQGRLSNFVFQGAVLYLPALQDNATRRLRTQGFEPATSWRKHEVAYKLQAAHAQAGIDALLAHVPAVEIVAF